MPNPENRALDFNEQKMMEDLKGDFNQLGKDAISSKISQQSILAQSVANGGPSSAQEAIVNLMNYLKIGVRAAALEVGVGRKKFSQMLDGTTPMPPEVISKIYTMLERKKPDLFTDFKPASRSKM